MTLRPTAARWFELVTVPQDLARTMECLSRTGAVELEARSAPDRTHLPDLEEQLKSHRELAKRYRAYWPAPLAEGKRRTEHMIDTLAAARQKLAAWQEAADPVIADIERIATERENLVRLKSALSHAGAEFPDLKLLAGAGPRLRARLFQLPAGSALREIPPLVLFKRWETDGTTHMLVVGRHSDIAQLETELASLKGRVLPLPDWLPNSIDAAVTALGERLAKLADDDRRLNGELSALNERQQIAAALGDIALIDWFSHHADQLRGSPRLAWITGWTSDIHGADLHRALDAEKIRYVLRLSEAPSGVTAPSVLVNPAWVRAFEVFARMLGTPARDESDPSMILAVIAPLIFGFMFGDVGQGLVLFAAGLVLGRRIPLLKMLVPGGLMAIVFGLAFGSVFCREDLVPALWIHPLTDPITVLVAAVVIGVAVLSVGLVLDALQAHWRGAGRLWWAHRAGLLVAYVGLIVAPVRLEALAVTAAGVVWFILGAAAFARTHRLTAAGQAVAEFAEQIMRLLINTVSFARVGAFALAHAGLSAAIVEVATASGRIGYWPMLLVGNVLIIALEGLVVGIQTTRLLMFEFFIRFLTGGGRAFKPLPPPDLAEMSQPQPIPEGKT
jgi:V/A-type H+-transporting ATPase subunit I